MATLLVDYENVYNSNGLQGVEYLTQNDKLHIFYSDSCGKIKADIMQKIEESECGLVMRKLMRAGRNALDFYIATECGAISQNGETQIAIISNDKGFNAIIDYFKVVGEERIVIVKAANIENALLYLNDPNDVERRKLISAHTKVLDLDVQNAIYAERASIHEKIVSAFSETKYKDNTDKIISFMNEKEGCGSKQIYNGALHYFGREAGMDIYRILKNVV